MSELISSWLNDEVQLSRKVINFEQDFSNGYLFGELLAKYNQQLNFNEFIDKNVRQANLKNFQLLEPTFKSLKLKFDTETVSQIITAKKGVALRVLYQLKMALEKVSNPADVNILTATGKLNTITPLKVIRPGRDQFDKFQSKFFKDRLDVLNKAQKVVDLDTKLGKFVVQQQIQEGQVQRIKEMEIENEKALKSEMRNIQLNKLQRTMAFMEDWTQKGHENWKKNQEIKHVREQKEKEFQEQVLQKKELIKTKVTTLEKNDVQKGIDEFESKLSQLGLTMGTQNDIERQQEEELLQYQQQQEFNATASLFKIRDRKMHGDMSRKERDKRRRKMIVDQAKAQREIEVRKREEQLLEKLDQQSKQEKEITYEIWRAEQCKEIIISNRNLRDQRYQSKREDIVQIYKFKEEAMLKLLHEEREQEYFLERVRQRELNIQQRLQNRKTIWTTCQHIVNNLLEFTDIAYSFIQDLDHFTIDHHLKNDLINLFIDGQTLIHRKTIRHPSHILALQPNTNRLNSLHKIAEIELYNYINGIDQWSPQHSYEQPSNPDTDDKYTPNVPLNNTLLGDIIRNIIQTKFPNKYTKQQQLQHDINQLIPLRLLLLGYVFSGKKVVSNFLTEKYGLLTLNIEDLIQEALDSCTPQDINQLEEEIQDNEQYSPYNNSLEQSTTKTHSAELMAIGQSIKECLEEGEPVSDELYIQLITHKLKQKFPSKNLIDSIKELEINLLKEGVINEIHQLSHNNNNQEIDLLKYTDETQQQKSGPPPTEEELIKYNLMQKEFSFTQGFARLLEKELSSFLPDDMKEENQAAKILERAFMIVKGTPDIIRERKLIQGGIDGVLHLEVDKEECLRRALGRRIDPQTGNIYHLDDNPPPTDNCPLIERLIPISDARDSEKTIVDRNIVFDQNYIQIRQWYQLFGDEDSKMGIWQDIDALGNNYDVLQRVDKCICEILSNRYQQFKEIVQGYYEQQRKEAEEEEQKLIEKTENEKMELIKNEFLKENLNKILNIKISNLEKNPEFLEYLYQCWNTIQNNYLETMLSSFSFLREQREFISMRFAEIQRRFLEFIQKPTDKFKLVLKYQNQYNSFIDHNPDMIEDDQTKEELHQRVDDLHDQIYEIIENKKEESLEERKNIMISGWIESEMQILVSVIERMVQCEVDRYQGCIQLAQDYYLYIEDKELGELPEMPFQQIILENEQTPIENPYDKDSFPRIQEIIGNALKVLDGQKEEETKNKSNVKQKKDETKKPVPNKKGNANAKEEIVEDDKKELTPNEIALKAVVNNEKAVLRYRFNVLLNYTISKIKELRSTADIVYNKLEDWILYSYKAENDAIDQLDMLFRQAIEKEEKIQKEHQLNYVDVVISQKTLNFLTPPPIMLPAKEERIPNRLSISQLYVIIYELQGLSNTSGQIETQQVLDYFTRKLLNDISKSDLPEEWLIFKQNNFNMMVHNLDQQEKGYIKWKSLCSYLSLLQSEILQGDQLIAYQEALQNNSENKKTIELNQFLEVTAWFEENQKSSNDKKNRKFDRVKLLKELLFFINKNKETDQLNINEYIETLSTKEYLGDKRYTPVNYQGLLFFDQNSN